MITNGYFKKPFRPHEVVRIDDNFKMLVELGLLMRELRKTTKEQRELRVSILDKMGLIGGKIFLDTFVLDLEIYEKAEAERVGVKQPKTFDEILERVKASALKRFEDEQTEIHERHEHHKTWLGCEVVEMFNESKKEAA